MTTVNPDRVRGDSDAPEPRHAGPFGWYAALRDALSRPLTSYYLLLGASALLLTIGLIMVLSASSVYSFEQHDGDSYSIVKRQLMWVAIGLPCAWIASRLPYQAIRQISWVAILVSVVLLALTAQMGVVVNGNKNWLAVGPFQFQPSEIAKLAIVLWAAHVYAQKERRLGSLHQVMVPVVPVLLGITLLVIVGKDLGTALVLFAILLALLWVVGAPARLFTLALSVIGVAAVWLATTSSERRERLTNFVDPFKDYHDAGWQPAHGLFALSSGGVFGEGIGASTQKWGDLPEAHTDFIFAVLGEELGLVGTLLVIVLFLDHRLRRDQGRDPDRRPLRALHVLRHRRLAGRPDDGQRRHGARPAARHRHPVAAHLLRRFLARAHPGGTGPAHRVRPSRARGGPRPAAASPAAHDRAGGRSRPRSQPLGLPSLCGSSSPAAAPPATPRP